MWYHSKSHRKFSPILAASILAIVLLTQLPVEVFAPSQGPNFATVAVNFGLGWDNPSASGGITDNNCATTSSSGRQIDLTGFVFGIPLDAIVTGIVVEVDYARDTPSPTASAQLLKAGSPDGTAKSFGRPSSSAIDCSTSNFVTLPATATDDLWNTTWIPADINDPSFGVRIDSGPGSDLRSLDRVRVTVYYVICGDPGLSATQQIACIIKDVQNLVDTGVLNQGQGDSLTVKLNNAKPRVDAGQVNAAIGMIQAFINQVNAFACDPVTDPDCVEMILDPITEATPLIDDASNIIATLDGDPVDMTFSQSNGVLSGTSDPLTPGETVKPVLIKNALRPAKPEADVNKLSIIEFTTDPAEVGPGPFNLQIIVSKQVLIAPAPDGNVLFSFDVNPSPSTVLSSGEFFTQLPVATFEVTNDVSPADVKVLFFDGNQWVPLSPPTLIDTTSDSFLMQVVLPHFSKFVVTGGGGVGGGGPGGGGGPAYLLVDTMPPQIVNQYYKPVPPMAGNEITVRANIIDDVGVSKAYVIHFIAGEEPKFIAMEKNSWGWFVAKIPASVVKSTGLSYQVYAEDFAGNNIQSSLQKLDVQQGPPVPEAKTSSTNLPAHVLEAIKSKQKPTEPVERLEVISMNDGNEIKSYPDKIIIKNTGNRTVDNIRIMLSSEISKSFRLSYPAIKSIEPNGNVTVTLELNGSPNRDMMGGLVGYKGKLMVMAEHHSPITLPVNIGSQESYYLTNYKETVASMAEQRYNKISLLNSILSKQPKTQYNYEVTAFNGDNVITNPSDELIIRNLSDKQLKNVRIYLSNAGHVFQLEQNNIRYLEPNGQISIKLIPRIDIAKYSPKDIKGELLIVPSNDKPIKMPIDIIGVERIDSADEFEVRTMSGNNTVTTAVDKITIKNIAERTMDSVKIILSSNLARIFSLSEDSFKTIEPNEEVTVEVKYNAKDLRTFMQNFEGEIKIVSEHHNMRTIPVKIQWNKVESDNFVVYARSGDLPMANNVLKYLENNYQNVTSAFGTVNHKATIYMVGSMEEMQSFYSYSNDVIFICSCDDPKDNALQEFIYSAMIRNFPTYYNMKKIENDNGNWLMDGIAKYTVVRNNETAGAKYIDVFKKEPVGFQWYGPPTDARYGAAITFFRYLEEAYGEDVIYRSLYRLGSGMASNNRCDTLESCAVLRGVYDAIGLDINSRRYGLDFDAIVQEWYFDTIIGGRY